MTRDSEAPPLAVFFYLQSGRWELNPVYLYPKQAYYRYTTARRKTERHLKLSYFWFRINRESSTQQRRAALLRAMYMPP